MIEVKITKLCSFFLVFHLNRYIYQAFIFFFFLRKKSLFICCVCFYNLIFVVVFLVRKSDAGTIYRLSIITVYHLKAIMQIVCKLRSEERRVGKESRSRMMGTHVK